MKSVPNGSSVIEAIPGYLFGSTAFTIAMNAAFLNSTIIKRRFLRIGLKRCRRNQELLLFISGTLADKIKKISNEKVSHFISIKTGIK